MKFSFFFISLEKKLNRIFLRFKCSLEIFLIDRLNLQNVFHRRVEFLEKTLFNQTLSKRDRINEQNNLPCVISNLPIKNHRSLDKTYSKLFCN